MSGHLTSLVDMRLPSEKEQTMNRPKVVCLCGSTRFIDTFREANWTETLKGNIVLSIGCDTKSNDGLKLTIVDKTALDILHLRKIDLADEILVINVNNYIGESTSREIEYARSHGKPVRYWYQGREVSVEEFFGEES